MAVTPRPRPPKAPRAWQRMLSGRRLDLLDPSPFDIEIEDIAHGLARVARWNGQTIGEHAFSVAQHSCVVEEIAAHIKPGLEPKWRLAALLHDASEYVIGDMISPVQGGAGRQLQGLRGPAGGRHPRPLRPAAQDPADDQDADQEGRPRLRLFRGHPAGRLQPEGVARLLRRAAAGLRPGHRPPARPGRPAALPRTLPRPGRGRRPHARRRRLAYGIADGSAANRASASACRPSSSPCATARPAS